MNTAAQNSEAAAQQQETEPGETGGEDFSSGEEFSDGKPPEKVANPIPVLKRIRRMSLLDLIVPAEKGISDKQADSAALLSRRKLQKGMDMEENIRTDRSYVSQVFYQKYLEEKLGNYRKPGQGRLDYQMEYLLCGKTSDRENLKATARRLLLIREGVNAAFLMGGCSEGPGTKSGSGNRICLSCASCLSGYRGGAAVLLVFWRKYSGSSGIVSRGKGSPGQKFPELAAFFGKPFRSSLWSGQPKAKR